MRTLWPALLIIGLSAFALAGWAVAYYWDKRDRLREQELEDWEKNSRQSPQPGGDSD